LSTAIDADAPFLPEDDTYHTPGEEHPLWLETTWWSFNVPERRIGGWLHAGYHATRNEVTWRVFAWDPTGADPARLAYYAQKADVPMPEAPDLRDLTFPGDGFSVKMLRPLMDYHVAYRDADRDFGIEFEHRSVHPPQRFTPGEPPALHNPHLDQLGHLTGELILRGERIEIDCHSIRDRTWGPRTNHPVGPGSTGGAPRTHRVLEPGGARWREIERERGRGRIQYIFGHADAQSGFLGFVRPQDGDARGWSPMNVGWLLRDGRFERLDKTKSRMRNFRDPVTGWSAHMLVSLEDVTGRRMEAEGTAESHMCEHGAGANALMRWEFDGEVGWGEDQDGWRVEHFLRMRDALRSTRRSVV